MSNLPKFLCIGVQKAATSWLWVQLRNHPDVWMPPVKELHYFDHLYVEENRTWTTMHIRKNVRDSLEWHAKNGKVDLAYFRYLIDLGTKALFTEEWYKHSFGWHAAEGRITGDVTPEYCMIPKDGIEYAQALLGEAKIIIMLREPRSRALSQIRMNAERRGIDLEVASDDQWMLLAREPVISSRSRYHVFPDLWCEVFGAGNLHFIDYERVSTAPAVVLQKLEIFLGLTPRRYHAPERPVHAGRKLERKPPSAVVDYLDATLQSQREAYSRLKALT